MDQRRKFVRLTVEGKVVYTSKETGGAASTATVQDISVSGLRMISSKTLSVKEQLRITLTIPGVSEELKTGAQVVWQRKISEQLFDTGIEFVDNDELFRTKLAAFIKKYTGRVEDRRAFIRCGLDTEITYYLERDSETERHCLSLDVSTSGLKVNLPEKLERGTRLRVSFKLPDDVHIIALCTVVAWAKKGEQDIFETGIEFTEIKSEDRARISAYVKNKLNIADKNTEEK